MRRRKFVHSWLILLVLFLLVGAGSASAQTTSVCDGPEESEVTLTYGQMVRVAVRHEGISPDKRPIIGFAIRSGTQPPGIVPMTSITVESPTPDANGRFCYIMGPFPATTVGDFTVAAAWSATELSLSTKPIKVNLTVTLPAPMPARLLR